MRVKTKLLKEWIENNGILKMHNLEKGIYIKIDKNKSLCVPRFGKIQEKETKLNLKIIDLQVKSIQFRSERVLDIVF